MNKKKFFIVEDDAIILFGLRAKLCAEGMEVETHNGTEDNKEVFMKIKEYNPDFIILDLMLPKADGLQLLSILKSDEETARIPVYIFSNLTDKDTKDQCEKMGAENYFFKGEYNIDEFVDKVSKIILNQYKVKN